MVRHSITPQPATNRVFKFAITCALMTLSVATPTHVTASSETPCKTVGHQRTAMVNGKREILICTKSGSKKVWRIAPTTDNSRAKSTKSANDKTASKPTTTNSVVVWRDSGKNSYEPTGKPPNCGEVSLTFPITDISQIVGILYPGQLRGGLYKAHGGFNTKTNDVQVVSPITGYITAAATYREMGEIQHMLDIQLPCGLAMRFDHLYTLSSPIKKIFDRFVPTGADTHSTFFNPPIAINSGDLIATTIGFVDAKNTNFDFGSYDFRQVQPSKRTVNELTKFGPDGTLGKYGRCMLSIFGPTIEAQLRALPTSDSATDFC